MNTSKNFYSIHATFTSFMTISLLIGLVFLATNNLDFVIASITYDKFSIANTAYCLSKTFGTIFLPLVFILPLVRMERIKVAKFMFIAYGVLQLLTLSWIVEFIIANGFDGLFSNEAIVAFQSAEERPFVASLVYWDTYTWWGSLFTLLYSSLCIYAGLCFDDDKKKVCATVLAVTLLRPLLAILSDVILGNGFLSSFWFTNNYHFLFFKLVNSIYTSFFQSMCTFFFSKTWRITC